MNEGQRIGEYTLVQKLGTGGMGETWLASKPSLDKKVVIKSILPELAKLPQAAEYFKAEGQLGARLHHGNIVNLVDRGPGYIVLEHVEGVTLQRLIEALKRVDPGWAVYICAHLAKALDYLHNAFINGQHGGVVHRDVTPDNVFLSPAAEVKLGDLGIAQIRAALAIRERTEIPGQIRGKYRYLSPEMARGEPLDSRADLFQLGLILYELLTGTAAFSGTRAGTESIARGEYRRISDLVADVPSALIAVTERLMATHPDQRYATAREAGEAIEDAHPTRFTRVSRELGEAVLRLADLRASTTFSVDDHMRAMLLAATMKPPREQPNRVVVQAAPEDRTLLPDGEPARPKTPLLPDEGVPHVIDSRPPRAEAVPEVVAPIKNARAARRENAPHVPMDMVPTAPLKYAPPPAAAPPARPGGARRRRRLDARIAVTFGAVASLLLVGIVGGVTYVSRHDEPPAAAAPKPSDPHTLQPSEKGASATPAAAVAAAPPPPIVPAAPPTENSAAKRRRVRPVPPAAQPAERVGWIDVRKDKQIVAVQIDGAYFDPPVSYKAEPGEHTVVITRENPPSETRTVVNVKAGQRYIMNRR